MSFMYALLYFDARVSLGFGLFTKTRLKKSEKIEYDFGKFACIKTLIRGKLELLGQTR